MSQINNRTNDIVLEKLNHEHAEHLYEILQDDRIYAYIPENAPESIHSLKERYKFLEKGSLKHEELWLNYAIFSLHEKKYIGTLQATIMLKKNSILIAYLLDPKVWGKGYGTKSLSMMMNELELKYKKFRFCAYIDSRNERSIRLVKNLGFTCVDYIENADFFKGSPSHEFVFEKQNNN